MKAIILGLDGATFRLIDPLMEDNVIPNIREIADNYASGTLTTIFPPVTAPAWLAIATGLNPGMTGVYDYINRAEGAGDEFTPVTSRYYKGRALWDVFNRNGLKSGVFNYPTLSPPPEVDGFSVTGMGAYHGSGLTCPAEIEDALDRLTGGYEVTLNLRKNLYRKKPDSFFDDIERIFSKQKAAFRYLMENYEIDMFFGVVSLTDWVQHLMFKYIDPGHRLFEENGTVKNRYRKFWAQVDDFVGEVAGHMSDETLFVIVSDHGSRPIDSAFYPNTWLLRKGFLHQRPIGPLMKIARIFDHYPSGSDNKYISKVMSFINNRILRLPGASDLIDKERSVAYCPDHNAMFGCINLTETGKGMPGAADDIAAELKALPETVDGIESVEIVLPKDIYHGPYVSLSPDIMFVLNSFATTVEVDFKSESFYDRPSISSRTGGHDMNGLFMAKGAGVRNAAVRDASVLDICPTVLAHSGLKLPHNVDGKVLAGIFEEEALTRIRVEYEDAGKASDVGKEGDGDLEQMKELLKSLGYM